MNLNCCHVAIALALANFTQLVFFFNYSLKIKAGQVRLEKKNGQEQEQINQLTEKVKKLEKKLSERN